MLAYGTCKCLYQPLKTNNIHKNNKYYFQYMPGYNSKEGNKKKKYYRVFPDNECYTYYETFHPEMFNKYFKIIHRKDVEQNGKIT